EFVSYDDLSYVAIPYVRSGLTAKSFCWALVSTYNVNWHPLTWMSFQLDSQIYGFKSWGFHLSNLVLHSVNVWLLFWTLKHMTGALWRSAFVAALFAVHPLHVEPVAWVSARKDVLSTFFWMLTLLAYVRYAEKPNRIRYVLVLLAFLLGLMAKP